MTTFKLVVILSIAFVFAGLLIATKFKSKSKYVTRDIMTRNEVEFFNRLRNAIPGYYIFPQVCMSAILVPDMPTNSKKYFAAYGRIAQKRIDWAIYTADLKLVCLVELDDSTHSIKSDQVRDSYTQSAGVKTIRWNTKCKPNINEIAHAINSVVN